MHYEGMNAIEANNLIKQTRPDAEPYFEILEQYSMLLAKDATRK